MRTIRTKVYKFSELSKDAQQKAIEKFWDINVDYSWHELAVEGHEERLSDKGYVNPKVMFSGFASQGDGACFTCDKIDFNIFLDGKYKDLDISASITHNWRYYFATSTTVNVDAGDDVITELYDEIQNVINGERENLGNEIYRELENEYDYLTGEDAIKETIEANEYEFTKDGNQF